MSRTSPHMRDFAERLIAYEARVNRSPETKTAACAVCERLRPHLGRLMGKTGFRALLSRSLKLAQVEIPGLGTLRVTSDGSLERFDQTEPQFVPEDMALGRVVLLAQLLGLLVAFIGETLTLRMLREVWPKLSFDDLDFGRG